MKYLAPILLALLLTGCGFVDEDLHLSDEELRAENALSGASGSGGIGFGSGRISTRGCGIGIGRSHLFSSASSGYSSRGYSDPRIPDDPAASDASDDVYPDAPNVDSPSPDTPQTDPIPRNINTWGEMVEWHYRNAKQRGEVDARTEAGLRAMKGN